MKLKEWGLKVQSRGLISYTIYGKTGAKYSSLSHSALIYKVFNKTSYILIFNICTCFKLQRSSITMFTFVIVNISI